MTRSSRFLSRMIMFVVAVALVAAILYPGLSGAFMANPVLNGVIVALMLVGIVYSFRTVISLNPEIAWMEAYRAQRSGGARGAAASSDMPQPRLLAPLAKMLGERQGRLVLTAMTMRSLLDGIGARISESREISRYLIGLLIFLGLLGTFWGLLQTIFAVADVIGGLSIEQGDIGIIFSDLRDGLSAPLAGMGTAFSSSLFGLAGSLVLGFLELQAGQAQNRFYNDLEDWLASVAKISSGTVVGGSEGEGSVPAYLHGLIEQTAENLDSLQRLIASGEEQRRQTNANLSALTDRLSTLTDQMRTEQVLMRKLAESQIELKPILTRLGEAASSGGFGIDETSRQHIRNLDVVLHRIADDLSSGRDRMTQELRSEIKLLARTIAALAEETSQ